MLIFKGEVDDKEDDDDVDDDIGKSRLKVAAMTKR